MVPLLFSPFMQANLAPNNKQPSTLQERLGYSRETKLLIVHADDLGVSHSENTASIYAMENGTVTSGSMMVPCPWFQEIADYAETYPSRDLGIHLTLTSEWEKYKWGPVTAPHKVPSLIDDRGYLHATTGALMKNGAAKEVEIELRNQIDQALSAGIKPTHFDAHMGAAVSTPEFLKIFIKLGEEYNVPVLLSREISALFNLDITHYAGTNDIVADRLIMAMPDDYKTGMKNFYTIRLKSLQPGLNLILIHAAYNDDEMKEITRNQVDYGASWRQDDLDFFTSNKCKTIINEEEITLITWAEIRDKLF